MHDHGMPVSQGELVRDMMDWFAGWENFPPPDERTAPESVSDLQGAEGNLSRYCRKNRSKIV